MDDEYKRDVAEALTRIGKNMVDMLRQGMIPKLKIPSRSTGNIVYSDQHRCFVLGNKRMVRSAGNVRHIKKLAQLLRVAYFCKNDLVLPDKHATLRELYYISESWGDLLKFDDQTESDAMLEDLEALSGYPREDMRVTPEDKGSIYGDLVVEYKDPKGVTRRVNCLDTPDGLNVGPRLDEAKIVECNASRVIAIETGGMYDRLVEERAFEKFDCILMHLGGQSSRSARKMLKKLSSEHEIPVYLFTDADPWGMHIAMVIISGSAKAAHINRKLAVPDAEWIGVTASDIIRYKLRTDKLSDRDIRRIQELMKDPRYQEDRWRKELEIWIKIRRKAEQQALAKYGLSYVVDEYLPRKFREIGA